MRFTPEQRQFAEAIRDFCARECGTPAQRRALTEDGAQHTSRELVERFAGLGWLGVSVPEAYGGAGAGMVEECIFLQESCRGLAPIDAYSTALTAGASYLRWGTEEQKREIMGGVCRGRLEAIALSEPGAGSDLAGARCAARREGEEYVIDGQKTWTSAAHMADHILTLVRTDPTAGRHHGLTLLIVGADAPGLEIRHRLADVATEVACCHALVYDIAQRVDADEEDALSSLSSMAKLKCTSVAKQAALEGMQLMGGYGYAREYGMEQQVRAALAPPIYGGTNEIQRDIIARSLGL